MSGSSVSQAEESGRTRPWITLIFSTLVALYCLWVLLLPIFPSQDGPMHLFFTHVLSQLLAHSSPVYEHYYYIRHILPPYSLYYYLLIALSKVVPLLWADKIVVALAIAGFAFGLRYLFIALGRNGQVMAMLIFPVLLNWPLFMGFVNFMLSLAMGAWALGVWTRMEERPSAGKRIAFALLLVLMTLTHPVPVGLVLVFCCGDLVFRTVDSWRLQRAKIATPERRGPWLKDLLLVLVVGACCAGYVSLFTVKHIGQQGEPAPSLLATVILLLHGRGLVFFGGRQLGTLVYRLSTYVCLLVALYFGVAAYLRRGTKAVHRLPRWLIFAALMFIALPIIPPDLNNSHFFRDRLVIVVWIAAFAAGSRYGDLSRIARTVLVSYGAVVAVAVLAASNAKIHPIAERVAEVVNSPLPRYGTVGLLLPGAKNDVSAVSLTFDPMGWAGAHYQRRTGGVMLNTPWLDLPILPIGARQGLLTDKLSPHTVEVYSLLRADLLKSAKIRSVVYPMSDYAMLIDESGQATTAPLDPVLAADTQDSWSCEKHDWFVLCARHPK